MPIQIGKTPDVPEQISAKAFVPALQIGTATSRSWTSHAAVSSNKKCVGLLGFTAGGVYGLFRAPYPIPFAAAVGVQSFYYGATITCMFTASLMQRLINICQICEARF